LRVWRELEGFERKKKRSKWKKYKTLRGGDFGVSSLYHTKSSSFGGTKKLYWRRVLWKFRGLH